MDLNLRIPKDEWDQCEAQVKERLHPYDVPQVLVFVTWATSEILRLRAEVQQLRDRAIPSHGPPIDLMRFGGGT